MHSTYRIVKTQTRAVEMKLDAYVIKPALSKIIVWL